MPEVIGPIGAGPRPPPISLIVAKIASASASIRSVSSSTYQEPPSGSATLATPVSSISTCWVRSAISADSLGRQRQGLVQGVGVQRVGTAEDGGQRLDRGADHVVVRLLRGQRHPGRLGVEAQRLRPSVVAPYTSRSHRAQIRRAARNFAISSKKSRWASKKKLQPGREHVDVQPAGQAELDVAEAVGQRERQLLRGGRAGLADVVAGDATAACTPGCRVAQYSIRSPISRRCGSGAKSHSFWAMYSLKMSVCRVPLSVDDVDALALGGDQVHAEHRDGRAGDGHRRGDRRRAGCRRRAPPCRRPSRWPPRSGRPRRAPAGRRSRGPSGSACRRRRDRPPPPAARIIL